MNNNNLKLYVKSNVGSLNFSDLSASFRVPLRAERAAAVTDIVAGSNSTTDRVDFSLTLVYHLLLLHIYFYRFFSCITFGKSVSSVHACMHKPKPKTAIFIFLFLLSWLFFLSLSLFLRYCMLGWVAAFVLQSRYSRLSKISFHQCKCARPGRNGKGGRGEGERLLWIWRRRRRRVPFQHLFLWILTGGWLSFCEEEPPKRHPFPPPPQMYYFFCGDKKCFTQRRPCCCSEHVQIHCPFRK